MNKYMLGALLSGLILLITACSAKGNIRITDLKCEMREAPEGIDEPLPRLSWKINSTERGVIQTKYHILVASSLENLDKGIGDFWDSGMIDSDKSIHVEYAGSSLISGQKYYWKVKVKTNKGNSRWSKPSCWSMGLLQKDDWKANWIGIDSCFLDEKIAQSTRLAARYLRKDFTLKKNIKSATLYISGLGLYEAFINGNRIGKQVLAPAPTDYDKSVKYNTFDVKGLLTGGNNAIGITLGNGRYFSMRPQNMKHYGFPKLLLQLVVKYSDSTSDVIVSDDSWKLTNDGPIRSNNEFDGEKYDARKEMEGWANWGFDDSAWQQAQLVKAPRGTVQAQMNPHIEIIETIKPISIVEHKNGSYILDMGQNMVGWIKMKVKGKRGNCVKLRFAEQLDLNGALYTDNLRSAKATDCYILSGKGVEEWEPSFTYHGFRFVEITGFPGRPKIEDFEGRVIHDKLAVVGQFETSNKIINQIYRNAFWGIRGNYRGVPTDCPQRDERMGWLGDRIIGSLGESFIFDNQLLYTKWMQDIEEAQSPEGIIPDVAPAYWAVYSEDVTWPSAYPVIINMLYKQYGDMRPIQKHYKSLKKWCSYMEDKYLIDGIIVKDTYGDWCMPPESPELIHSIDPNRKTDGTLLATAYYYKIMLIMERFAILLNLADDATHYSRKAQIIKDSFNNKFFDAITGRYGNNTVTANLLPLAFGMVPKEKEVLTFQNIVDKTMDEFNCHVSTGVIGMQWLMRTLTQYGRGDIAMKLTTNRDYPSWGYMIEKGATTIWELWNGDTADPAMNSANHVMLLGDLIVWYFENLAGIKNSEASYGFKEIIMKPSVLEGLKYVKASYNSVYGLISSEWHCKNNKFEWNISIPANTTALVYIPAINLEDIKESDVPLKQSEDIQFISSEKRYVKLRIGSGNYRFVSVY